MEDTFIVAQLVDGNIAALEHAYDKYSARLYTYARTIAPHAAEDAVTDTFLLAHARIAQLRDPAKLRPWLYAICRNQCLRELRRDKKHTMVDPVAINELPADPEFEADASDAGTWVSAAYAGMNTSDVDVLTLALRHDLGSAEIALVWGISSNEAAAKLSRARNGLEDSLQALVAYQTGMQRCSGLRAICGEAQFDILLRKRINKHLRSCKVCGERRKKAAAFILAGPAWAMVAAPTGIKETIFTVNGAGEVELSPAAIERTEELLQSEPPFNGDGWPSFNERAGHGIGAGHRVAALVSVAAVAIVLGGGLLIVRDIPGQDVPVGAPTTPSAGQELVTPSMVARTTPAPIVSPPKTGTPTTSTPPPVSPSSKTASTQPASPSPQPTGTKTSTSPTETPTETPSATPSRTIDRPTSEPVPTPTSPRFAAPPSDPIPQ